MSNVSALRMRVQRYGDYARPRYVFSSLNPTVKTTAFVAGIALAPIATLATFLGYETAGVIKEAKQVASFTAFSKKSFTARLVGTASLGLGTILFTGLKLGLLAESTFFQAGAVLTTAFGLLTLAAEKVVRSLKTWLSIRAIAREVKSEEDKNTLRQALTELPEELSQKLTSKLAKRGVVI